MFIFLILAGVVIGCTYFALSRYHNYWKSRNVPHLPVSTLFGNFGSTLIMEKSFAQIYDDIYKNYPNLPYAGYYQIRQPGLLLRDPKLIGDVLVKNFNNFHDNEMGIDEAVDPFITRNPFFAIGDRWKYHRNRLGPGLTPKQIENMFPSFMQKSDDLVQYLMDNENKCVDGKELVLKYTCECVAACAFGIDAQSFKDPNSKFKAMGKTITSPSFLNTVRFLLLFIFPTLATIMKIKVVADEVGDYFKSILIQTIKFRKENKIVRNDFLDIMINMKEKINSSEFTDVDFTGYSLSIFLDGLENSAVTIHYVLYDLGNNPHVQNQLRDYVKDVLSEHSEGLTYKTLQEMKFLDQVVSETLRMHPPALFMTKLCTKKCGFPSLDNPEKEMMIELGTKITIPINSLHFDEKYFENPTKFDPERFSEENKDFIEKFTYLPFGGGPRMCIGQKLAMLKVKMAIIKVILNFEIRINCKTKTPIEMDPACPFNAAKGGIWLDFYPIKEKQ